MLPSFLCQTKLCVHSRLWGLTEACQTASSLADVLLLPHRKGKSKPDAVCTLSWLSKSSIHRVFKMSRMYSFRCLGLIFKCRSNRNHHYKLLQTCECVYCPSSVSRWRDCPLRAVWTGRCLRDAHSASINFYINISELTYTLATKLLSQLNIIAGWESPTKR